MQELELEFQKFRTENIMPCYNRLDLSRNVNNSLWKGGYTSTEALDKTSSSKLTTKPTKKNLNLQKVLQDIELEGIISQVITTHQVTNLQSLTLRDRILNMLELFESEIKKERNHNTIHKQYKLRA